MESIVAGLTSRQVWAAKKGHGSFLTFDIGDKHRSSDSDREVAALHLWVYLCDWQIRRSGELLLNSDQTAKSEYERVLTAVVGEYLIDVHLGDESWELVIAFSGEYQLILKQNLEVYDADDDMLLVYRFHQPPAGYRADVGLYRDQILP